MGFDPSLIQLTNLYTDAITYDRSTDVFTNGEMQAAVFATFNYFGDPKDAPQAVSYVVGNMVIMVLSDDGTMEPSPWTWAPMTNGFKHDVYRDTNVIPDNDGQTRNLRAGRFLLVPESNGVSLKWCAKLGDQITSIAYPVIVEGKPYVADPKQFEIVDRDSLDDSILRVMKYKLGDGGLPEHHKLKTHVSINGIRFDIRHDQYGRCNVYITFAMKKGDAVSSGGFLDYLSKDYVYPATPIESRDGFIYDGKIEELNEYPNSYPNPAPKDYYMEFDREIVDKAWLEGIVMYQHSLQYMELHNAGRRSNPALNFETRCDIHVQDNFGNYINLDIDWNVDEKQGGPKSYYKCWKVVQATTLPPPLPLQKEIH